MNIEAFKHLQEVLISIPGSRQGMLIFGSAARGDMDDHSDIDVLVLKNGPSRTTRIGRVNVSSYSRQAINKMAEEGSLFIRHLIMDGAIVEDPQNFLEEALGKYQRPLDYSPFRTELESLLPLFDISEQFFWDRPDVLISTAAFCLRSEVYIRADEHGILSFSLRALKVNTHWKEVDVLLRAKTAQCREYWNIFQEIVTYLENSFGSKSVNPYESIEAYIVNSYEDHPLVTSLGLRILSGADSRLNYDILSPFSWSSDE